MLQGNALQSHAPGKKQVVGVSISTTSYSEVVSVAGAWIEARREWVREPAKYPASPVGRYVCVTSVHGVVSSVLDPAIRQVINDADIATPDGMPLVWALRSFGVTEQQRVYGPDLMLAVCLRAAESGHRVFLYGGQADTLDLLENNLVKRFPSLCVAGKHSPPFRPLTPEESKQVIRMVRESESDIVFVGLSTPKQERWMAQHRDLLPGIVLFGVGAAFDFHAGTVKQAPLWMRRSGLEWLFRLVAEPRRLWKRYLLVTPLFLPLWAMQKLRILRYAESEQKPVLTPEF